MILLFTDFGPTGPYTGQMIAALHKTAPDVPAVDLINDVPAFDPQSAAYLLAALIEDFPDQSIFLCVVDPGVGSDRHPIVVKTASHWFVGPDNGIFDIVIRRSDVEEVSAWQITYEPERLSASFHGRDLFAPVAARIALDEPVPGERILIGDLHKTGWPDDLARIIYIDHFGNAITGIRAKTIPPDASLICSDYTMSHARVFSEVENGALFWYENANGLAEIAVNQGRADEFGFTTGMPVTVISPNRAERQVF